MLENDDLGINEEIVSGSDVISYIDQLQSTHLTEYKILKDIYNLFFERSLNRNAVPGKFTIFSTLRGEQSKPFPLVASVNPQNKRVTFTYVSNAKIPSVYIDEAIGFANGVNNQLVVGCLRYLGSWVDEKNGREFLRFDYTTELIYTNDVRPNKRLLENMLENSLDASENITPALNLIGQGIDPSIVLNKLSLHGPKFPGPSIVKGDLLSEKINKYLSDKGLDYIRLKGKRAYQINLASSLGHDWSCIIGVTQDNKMSFKCLLNQKYSPKILDFLKIYSSLMIRQGPLEANITNSNIYVDNARGNLSLRLGVDVCGSEDQVTARMMGNLISEGTLLADFIFVGAKLVALETTSPIEIVEKLLSAVRSSGIEGAVDALTEKSRRSGDNSLDSNFEEDIVTAEIKEEWVQPAPAKAEVTDREWQLRQLLRDFLQAENIRFKNDQEALRDRNANIKTIEQFSKSELEESQRLVKQAAQKRISIDYKLGDIGSQKLDFYTTLIDKTEMSLVDPTEELRRVIKFYDEIHENLSKSINELIRFRREKRKSQIRKIILILVALFVFSYLFYKLSDYLQYILIGAGGLLVVLSIIGLIRSLTRREKLSAGIESVETYYQSRQQRSQITESQNLDSEETKIVHIGNKVEKIYCINCGHQLPANSDFCPKCGNKNEPVSDDIPK